MPLKTQANTCSVFTGFFKCQKVLTAWVIASTLALLLHSFSVLAQADLRFRHILPEQVEQLGYINSITQDQLGFMWFGGDNGLARYDGYTLTLYRHEPDQIGSLSNNQVRQLAVLSDKALWITTENGLNRYSQEGDNFQVFRNRDSQTQSSPINDIRSILEDSKGRIWLGSAGGLIRFNKQDRSFSKYPLATFSKYQLKDEVVYKLAEDQQGFIWIGLLTGGLIRLNPDTGDSDFYRHEENNPLSLRDNNIRALMVDRENNLWVGTYNSVVSRMGPERTRFKHFIQPKVLGDAIWKIIQNDQGTILVGDGLGLCFFDPKKQKFKLYNHDKNLPFSLGNLAVREIYIDKANDPWLGFFPTGVDKLDKRASAFRNYNPDPEDENSITGGGISAIVEDKNNKLWVGTHYGLNHLDLNSNTVKRYLHQKNNSQSIIGKTVLSLLLDSRGYLWVGTWAKGLSRYSPASGEYRHYNARNNAKTNKNRNVDNSLLGDEVWRIIEDSQGKVWVATQRGLNIYDREKDQFTQLMPPKDLMSGKKTLSIRDLLEDSQNNIWIASDSGLYLYNLLSRNFKHYFSEDKHSNLPVDYIRSLYEDSTGNLWLGTHGAGLVLFDRKTETATSYNENHGLSNPVVSSVAADQSGNLWLSTLGGLARFNPKTKQFRNYMERHGIAGNVFNRNTISVLKNGNLIVGSADGLTLFNPDKLEENPVVAETLFTEFRVFNTPVQPATSASPLKTSIFTSEAISLKHKQSVFSLEYAALSYRSPEENTYRYKLQGFDKDWINAGHRRNVTYTNLDPGKYIFKVKAANNDGIWNEQPQSLRITIIPPLWQRWWAWLVYIFLSLSIIWFGLRVKARRLELEKEKKLNTELKKVDKLKDAFLANTSHELRTPLNGIIGIAETMSSNNAELSPKSIDMLTLISSSAKRLSNLINDILDYSKITEDTLELNIIEVDLAPLADLVMSLLQALVHEEVKLIKEIDHKARFVMGDENRLQQILVNLVGNAIKFTDKGSIKISSKVQGAFCIICVSDTGTGINQSALKNIFNAFSQVDDEEGRKFSGTGLGLAIAKQLVELQGGEIKVESQPGVGSHFSFTVKLAPNSAFEKAPLAVNIDNEKPEKQEISPASTDSPPNPEYPVDRESNILIVDDDKVNRIVLEAVLKSAHHGVVEAGNGRSALKTLEQGHNIDLVILDMLMPDLSGLEVCRQIRTEYSKYTLPIIFLSAKKTDSDLKEGQDAGGNEFMEKPIDKEALLSTVGSLLNLRKKHREN